MPDESNIRANDEQTLTVPGVLSVSPIASGKKRIRVGPSAGWMVPQGIMQWEHELSFLRRADATAEVATALRGTLPHEQIAPKKFAMASRAAQASPLLAIASNLVGEARGQGVRVYTVGVDRVSSGFYYFAEGGAAEPVRVQGNLIEMLAPALDANTTNAEIEALLEGLIERLLLALSNGTISELDVELADALPRLSRDGTGLAGTNLETFDANARSLALQSAPWEGPARKIVDALALAARSSLTTTSVPLYGEARRESRAALEVYVGGKPLHLPEQALWTVFGLPREEAWAAFDSMAPPAGLAHETSSRSPPASAPAPAMALSEPLEAPLAPTLAGPASFSGKAPELALAQLADLAPAPTLEPVTPAPIPMAPSPELVPGPGFEAAREAPGASAEGTSEAAKEMPDVVESPSAENLAPTEVATPPNDAQPVLAQRQDRLAKKSQPISGTTLLLVAAIVYFILRKMHWIH